MICLSIEQKQLQLCKRGQKIANLLCTCKLYTIIKWSYDKFFKTCIYCKSINNYVQCLSIYLNDAKKINNNNTNINLHISTYLAYNGLKGENLYIFQSMSFSSSDLIKNLKRK